MGNILARLLGQGEKGHGGGREVVEEVLALYEDGFSFREIAREVGLPLSTVHRIVRKHAPSQGRQVSTSDFEAFMQQFERFSRAMRLFNRFADEKRFEDHPLGAFAPLAEAFGKAVAAHISAMTLAPLVRAQGASLPPSLPPGNGSVQMSTNPQPQAQEVSVDYLVSLVQTQTPEQAAQTVVQMLSQTAQGQAILATLRGVEPEPGAAQVFLARARAFVPSYQPLFETLERNMDWFLGLLRALRQMSNGTSTATETRP